MRINEANCLKVKHIDRNKEYLIESQEHCDLLWCDNGGALAGDYVFYNYPDLSKIVFNVRETKEKLYFDVLEYSFDYGETWSSL